MLLSVVGLLTLPVARAGAVGNGRVVLVREGEPAAAIVLAERPTVAAQFAAHELQWHVSQMTGATLPILAESASPPAGCASLFVGDTQAAREAGLRQGHLAEQERVVQFVEDAVLFVGRDARRYEKVVYALDDLPSCANWPGFWEERGTVDAVYDFLEELCGVRWLSPTEGGTILPQARTLSVPRRDLRRQPAFEFRDAIGATGDDPLRYDAYTALWPEDAEGFRRWETAAYPQLHAKYGADGRYLQAKRELSRLFLLRMRNGGKPVRCNHSLYGFYQRFWERSEEPNAAKLFVERRPEMFAQGYEGEPPQMCYTSRALIEQLVQDARDYYDREKTGEELAIFWRPTLPNPFPVEPMDNSSFCKCDACREWLAAGRTPGANVFSTGLYSDYFFGFINEVQRGLAQTHAEESIVTLAYASHAMMPARVELDPRVAVQFCFAMNRTPWSREGYESEVRLLKQWGSEGVGRPLYLWLYYTFPVETANNGKYHCFPGFFAHTIGEQFRLFRQYGYRGMFHCGYGQEVESYVTFRLMDDPEAQVDGLLREYFAGLYGAAAGPMQRLYAAIEQTYCDPANYPAEGVSGAELAWGHVGTEARMARFGGLLQEAKALAETDAERRRVELFELGVWSYMTAGRAQYLERTQAPIPAVTAPRIPDAGGEPDRADWSQAAALPGSWYERGGAKASTRTLGGRIAHDGAHLYVELTDACDPAKLEASAMVFPFDDWELFIAGQRALPYRQYAVGPTGLITALSHGEVNFRRNVPLEEHGVRARSDTTAPDRWTVRLSIPLASIVVGGVQPGGKLYLNILRVSSPAVNGTGALGLDTWVSHCTVHEVDRLGEVGLAP